MTKDIKDRLRNYPGDWPTESYHDLVHEAADRIEELESALAWEKARTKTAVIAERERLKPWLRHKDGCHPIDPLDRCTCGLDAATKKEPEAEAPDSPNTTG